MIAFTVPGKPCAKQSVRFTNAGRRYQPADVLAYRDKIGFYARQACPGKRCGPVKIEIVAAFQVPKSWSGKRKREAAWHTSRPDVDNITKAALDGIKGVLIIDDSQVAKLDVRKVWVNGGEEGLSITLTDLGLVA